MNNLISSYKYYRKTIKGSEDRKTYLDIVGKFMLFLMDKVFEGFEVKLPAKMGSFYIVGRRVKPSIDENGEIKGVAPNWAETKKLWDNNEEAKKSKTLVYCFNERTNGIKYKLIWSRRNVNLVNKMIYSFRLSRTHKRRINELVTSGKEYLVMENNKIFNNGAN